MRKAFSEIARRAYDDETEQDVMRPEYVHQQQELNSLMLLMNSAYSGLLKYYALVHAPESIGDTEELEKARLTQLTFEGLSLELTTIDLTYDDIGGRIKRSTSSTSILFPQSCSDADQVETELIAMFSDAQQQTR